MDRSNLGKLMWERRLFEMSGNDEAAERIGLIIEKILSEKGPIIPIEEDQEDED